MTEINNNLDNTINTKTKKYLPNIKKLRETFNQSSDIFENQPVLIIKNYKTLCELLDMPILGGKSKTYQNKQFRTFFDYEKQGQKYIIKEIYDKPLPDGIYKNPIDILNEFMICYLLNQSESGICSMGMNSLAYKLGYVNQLYVSNRNNKHAIAANMFSDNDKYAKENLAIVVSVFNDIQDKYKYRIEKTINRLEKEGSILFETVYLGEPIDFEDVSVHKTVDDYGDIEDEFLTLNTSDFVTLDDKTKEKYQTIREELISSFSIKIEDKVVPCSSLHDIYAKGINPSTGKPYISEYYEKLRNETIQLGYNRIVKSYKFFYNPTSMKNRTVLLYDQLQTMNMLNDLFKDKLLTNYKNFNDRQKQKFLEKSQEQNIDSSKVKDEFDKYDRRNQKQNQLIEDFLDLNKNSF